MNRRIIYKGSDLIGFNAIEPLKPDNFIDKLIKYIPIETISAYVVIQKLIEQNITTISPYLSIGIIVFFVICNFFYLKKIHSVDNFPQLIISSIAFIVWAYTLIEPFKSLGIYNATYSMIAIILTSFIMPLFNFKQ